MSHDCRRIRARSLISRTSNRRRWCIGGSPDRSAGTYPSAVLGRYVKHPIAAEGHGFSRAAQDVDEAFQGLQALRSTASAAGAVL
jgi:hypothetical protein